MVNHISETTCDVISIIGRFSKDNVLQRDNKLRNGRTANLALEVGLVFFPHAYAFQFDVVLSWPNLPNISEKMLTLSELWANVGGSAKQASEPPTCPR